MFFVCLLFFSLLKVFTYPSLFSFSYFPLSRDLLSDLTLEIKGGKKVSATPKNLDCKINQHMMLPNKSYLKMCAVKS